MSTQSREHIETHSHLRRVIHQLSPKSPLTNRFSERWRKLRNRVVGQLERKRVWYKTQHEHWLGWLGEYDGPGGYNRKNSDRSAEFVYNHIVNPQMLIYLAEAVKVNPVLLAKAMKAALSHRASMSAMSSAIRRIIPWTIVERALMGDSKLLSTTCRTQRMISAPCSSRR